MTGIRITINDQSFTAQLADNPTAPSGDLVFYYGDVGYWNGIVRIGRVDADDLSLIERQPDGFELTIQRG